MISQFKTWEDIKDLPVAERGWYTLPDGRRRPFLIKDPQGNHWFVNEFADDKGGYYRVLALYFA